MLLAMMVSTEPPIPTYVNINSSNTQYNIILKNELITLFPSMKFTRIHNSILFFYFYPTEKLILIYYIINSIPKMRISRINIYNLCNM
jgi:hypothetical protein